MTARSPSGQEAAEIDGYRLAETGPDTGVFAGEVTLTGFTYGEVHTSIETGGSGPTDGTLRTNNEDGLSVSFEYSDSEAPLVASALPSGGTSARCSGLRQVMRRPAPAW